MTERRRGSLSWALALAADRAQTGRNHGGSCLNESLLSEESEVQRPRGAGNNWCTLSTKGGIL